MNFFEVSKVTFDNLGVAPNCIELGVFADWNAENLYKILHPNNLHPLDTWSAEEYLKVFSIHDI